jgi:c(7)-type cytochrome triheme protein
MTKLRNLFKQAPFPSAHVYLGVAKQDQSARLAIKSFYMPKVLILLIFALFMTTGCNMREEIDLIIDPSTKNTLTDKEEIQDYYDKLYMETTRRVRAESTGISDIKALDPLPKDPQGNVNWTAAVVQGLINPKPSLDPNVVDDPPLKLNIFIEAKVPLMANVIFPHSIHTYWLSCKNCHPKIFLPEAGANPISMDEIFKGEWCGRCHGKVAFNFWPRENCLRCHMVLKGQSMQQERWR